MTKQTIGSFIIASLMALMMVSPAFALDDETVDAAVGGGLGGAAGAAIGNEIGGRNGAILGGAVGGAGGAAVTTDDDDHDYYRDHDDHYRGRDFCPPGQAKKGRC